jgi:cell division septation protein DedD
MKNNETGEFELVLGNRQLLSGFFIVVILFAVFFVMGYIVGRNSTPATQMAANRDAGVGTGTPSPQRPQASSGSVATPQNAPAATSESKDDSTATEQPPATQPPPAAAVKTEAPAAADNSEGTYWQVVSIGAHDAELLARTLKDKGFPASLSPAPNGKTTRVLVGPYADLSALGKAKVELENLGFHPIVKR